jgi:hypothetical protein
MNGQIGDISITLPLRLCSSVSNFGNEFSIHVNLQSHARGSSKEYKFLPIKEL